MDKVLPNHVDLDVLLAHGDKHSICQFNKGRDEESKNGSCTSRNII